MDVPPAIRTRYRAYLASADWRTRRNRRLQLARYHCEQCGARRSLEVHHLTYDRLGHEWDQDLAVLCRDCHEGTHRAAMHDAPAARLYLLLAETVLRDRPFDSVADLADAVKAKCAEHKIAYNAHQVDRALALLGARVTPPPRPAVAAEVTGRPPTTAEARELLRRLHAAPRIMPASKPSPIDIYAAVERDEADHDRY